MARTKLSEHQWTLIKPLLPGKSTDPGRSGFDNRKTVEGILWIIRTGAPWRDLPCHFGQWGTVYQRFRRWAIGGVFERIFAATGGKLDLRSVQADGSYAKVHQHAAGAPKEDAHPRTLNNTRPSGEVEVG